MKDITKLTHNDAIFFLDMINSTRSPNYEPGFYKRKTYYKLLKHQNSDDYRRFISVYKAMRHILTEREQIVLNKVYGTDGEPSNLKSVGAMLNVSPERAKQIRSKGERKIARELYTMIKCYKSFF